MSRKGKKVPYQINQSIFAKLDNELKAKEEEQRKKSNRNKEKRI